MKKKRVQQTKFRCEIVKYLYLTREKTVVRNSLGLSEIDGLIF